MESLEQMVRGYLAALDAEAKANAEINARAQRGEWITINAGEMLMSALILDRIRSMVQP